MALVEWLSDNVWAVWMTLAIVFGVVETLTADLVFLMLAGGALAGVAASLLGAPLAVSALVVAVASAALLGVVRPVARRHVQTAPLVRTGTAALIGSRGRVVEPVDGNGGTIKLGGEIWTARAVDGAGPLAPGTPVSVIRIEGATALVYPAEEIA
jgi:membrane protein implicated in regulation of membrane protease activity